MKLACSALVAMVFVTGIANADPHSEARRHFDLGRKARASGELATAITEFQRSLDSERSVGALFNLGGVYEEQGRHRLAIDRYEEARILAASLADPRAAEALAAERAIRAGSSWVTIIVKPEIAALAGFRVVVDDEPVVKSELDAEVFRDRKEHHVLVTADSHEGLSLTTSDHGTVEITDLSASVPVMKPTVSTAEPSSPPSHARTWGAIGLGAGGALAVGAGVVATVGYANTRSELRRTQASLQSACTAGQCPSDAAAQSRANQQRYTENNHRAAAEMGIGFGAGALLFAGATYLLVTRPSGTAASFDVTLHGASVGLRTVF